MESALLVLFVVILISAFALLSRPLPSTWKRKLQEALLNGTDQAAKEGAELKTPAFSGLLSAE